MATKTWAAIRGNNSIAEVKTAEDQPFDGAHPWREAPPECVAGPDATPQPGEWGWNPMTDAVEIVAAPTPDEQRPGVLAALRAERNRALIEDGVTIVTAAAGPAKFRLNKDDQQNIAGTAINGGPAGGLEKTSLDHGEVPLTAEECVTLGDAARDRVITVVTWYKAQKAAVEKSDDPTSLLPFTAPVET